MRKPSKSQNQAMIHLSGPAMVTAGPGSGKTFTIVQRILYLIRNHHIPPENILVITYTRAAAAEMRERFLKESALAGVHSGQRVSFGTFHSICYNILRKSGVVKSDSLIKEKDRRRLLEVILGNMGQSSKAGYDAVSGLENAISRMKNGLTEDWAGPEKSQDFTEEELIQIRASYDAYLREQGLLDFDDMITCCHELLLSNQSVCNQYRHIFSYILVDEFQDINPPQYEILKLLAFPENNLFVVGDDDQAIYGFRGATPGIMRQFLADYQDTRNVMLTENYRCGSEIVRLAGQVISRNKERFSKKFIPVNSGGEVCFACFERRKEEEEYLLKALAAKGKEAFSDTAVIVRTNREAVQYAELLRGVGIPVAGKTVGKEDIYHGFIMRDIQAFLAFLYEGNKRSDFICFMNKPSRFITRTALPCEKVLPAHLEQYYFQNPDMRAAVQLLFRQLDMAARLNPFLAVSLFRRTLGYDRYLRERAGDHREEMLFLGQADRIQKCFQDFKAGISLKEFVEMQAQKAGAEQPEMTESNGVSVMTMHSAKGLEFGRVFLPDVNEGIIPGKECRTESALEEERRLLYVAITRAEKELHIYFTKERGRSPSRYLEGLIPVSAGTVSDAAHAKAGRENPAALRHPPHP